MVTNMTGFLTIERGLSFLNDVADRRADNFPIKKRRSFCVIRIDLDQKSFPLKVRKCSTIGPSVERRQKIQRADQQHGADEQDEERAAGDRECARARRRDFLLHERTGQGHDRHDHEEAAEQHGEAKRGVVPGRVGGETSERAAVVAGAGAEGVKNFAQARAGRCCSNRPGPICSRPPRPRNRGSKSTRMSSESIAIFTS